MIFLRAHLVRWLVIGLIATTATLRAAHGSLYYLPAPGRTTENQDTLAWSLLAVTMVTMGLVTACGWGIYRQQRRPGPESELMDDIRRLEEREKKAAAVRPPPASRGKAASPPPWEKPADWWRKDFPSD